MKKFNLILAVLVAAAFGMTSCIEPVAPTINVDSEITIDLSDLTTNALSGTIACTDGLSKVVFTSNYVDGNWAEITVNEFSTGNYVFALTGEELSAREGLTSIVITATSLESLTATATVIVNIETSALEPAAFTWQRIGANAGTGLAEFGLRWESNVKEIHAIIQTLEGTVLYELDPTTWTSVVTEADKVAAIAAGTVITDYRGISAEVNKDYDVVIATIVGTEYHLIHITRCDNVEENNNWTRTITGEAK